jgi:aminopeptidase N
MRTEDHRPVRLSEYRPPGWLVETVDLDVKLHPTQTPVRATLKVRPNPAADAPAPLTLDGDGLTLVSLKIDGAPVAKDAYYASPDGLTIAHPPQHPFTIDI